MQQIASGLNPVSLFPNKPTTFRANVVYSSLRAFLQAREPAAGKVRLRTALEVIVRYP